MDTLQYVFPEFLTSSVTGSIINVMTLLRHKDYGIFYIDIFENLANYIDKTVCFKARAAHPKEIKKDNVFVVGRPAMTCCAEDIAFVGFPCQYAKQSDIKEGSWINVTAIVKTIMNRQLNEPTPIMLAKKIEETNAPEDEVAYFY